MKLLIAASWREAALHTAPPAVERARTIALELVRRGHEVLLHCAEAPQTFHVEGTVVVRDEVDLSPWIPAPSFSQRLSGLGPDRVIIAEPPRASDPTLEWTLAAIQLAIPVLCLGEADEADAALAFHNEHAPLFDAVVLSGAEHGAAGAASHVAHVPPLTMPEAVTRIADFIERTPAASRISTTDECARLGFTPDRLEQALSRLHPSVSPSLLYARAGRIAADDGARTWIIATRHADGLGTAPPEFTRLIGRAFIDADSLERHFAREGRAALVLDRNHRVSIEAEAMPNRAVKRGAPTTLPQNLVKVIPAAAARRLRCDLEKVSALADTHRALWNLEDQARSSTADDATIAKVKRAIDAANGQRHHIIADIDAGFRLASAPEGRRYSETPGELCDRLIILDLKISSTTRKQYDATLPDDTRRMCIAKVAELTRWRAHLTGCLETLLDDVDRGVAVLPPRAEIKLYNDKMLNPVTRAESGPETALRRRATPLSGVRHVVGIGCTLHGASLAYVNADGVVRASVLDRWTGQKHTLMVSEAEAREYMSGDASTDTKLSGLIQMAYGRIPPYRVFETDFQPWLEWLLRGLDVKMEDIDLVVTSPSHVATTKDRLGPHLNRWFPNARVVLDVEHYPIHECQAFWQSGFEEAAVLTLDNCGEDLERLGSRKGAGTISIMRRDGTCRIIREFLFPESSSGLLYSMFHGHVGFKEGEEGKTMGLAPFGGPELYHRLRPRLRLYDDGSFDFMNQKELGPVLWSYVPSRPNHKSLILPRHENVAYAAQALLEDIVTNAFNATVKLTGLRDMVYAGGVGLNSCANEKARVAAGINRFYVAPNASDTGQALGAALYGAYEVGGWTPRTSELPEYLGPPYTETEVEAAARSTTYHVTRPADPARALAHLIAQGLITARWDGGAEYGPRALGNRSILADARQPWMKDYLNERVKFRETFRPYAPTVLAEHATEWFDMGDDPHSPYMLRVVDVPTDKAERIPAVIHVDGTARVQTLTRAQNPGYYAVVEAFHEMTGVPVILDTSFNLAGKPIVETPQDAVDCFNATLIDALLVGPWLLTKAPMPADTPGLS